MTFRKKKIKKKNEKLLHRKLLIFFHNDCYFCFKYGKLIVTVLNLTSTF